MLVQLLIIHQKVIDNSTDKLGWFLRDLLYQNLGTFLARKWGISCGSRSFMMGGTVTQDCLGANDRSPKGE